MWVGISLHCGNAIDVFTHETDYEKPSVLLVDITTHRSNWAIRVDYSAPSQSIWLAEMLFKWTASKPEPEFNETKSDRFSSFTFQFCSMLNHFMCVFYKTIPSYLCIFSWKLIIKNNSNTNYQEQIEQQFRTSPCTKKWYNPQA